ERRDTHRGHPHRRPAPQDRGRSREAAVHPDRTRQGLPLVQLRTQRTALTLYGVLLVLPTLVLGGLQWRQLEREYALESSDVPHKAEDAAFRFRQEIANQLDLLLDN